MEKEGEDTPEAEVRNGGKCVTLRAGQQGSKLRLGLLEASKKDSFMGVTGPHTEFTVVCMGIGVYACVCMAMYKQAHMRVCECMTGVCVKYTRRFTCAGVT